MSVPLPSSVLLVALSAIRAVRRPSVVNTEVSREMTEEMNAGTVSTRQSGGYSGGVPPLPIPNREVKPVIADGTAMQCGRVGSRLLLSERFSGFDSGKPLFFCIFHAF